MSSYWFVDKVEYFSAICIPLRLRQQASPKCWYLSTDLHGAIRLQTDTSARSSYGIWRLLFAVSWPYCTSPPPPRVGGRAADYVNTIDEPTEVATDSCQIK